VLVSSLLFRVGRAHVTPFGKTTFGREPDRPSLHFAKMSLQIGVCREQRFEERNKPQWAVLRTAANQCLVSLTLGFGKFALEPPAGADPVLIVIGLPGLVFITQGPSGHVKHP
jgi:hypothetical protein